MLRSVLLLVLICSSELLISQTYYARKDADWDDNDAWSTVGPGGAACTCYPGTTSAVVVNGYKIKLKNASATIGSLEISNSYSSTSNKDAELEIDDYTLIVNGNVEIEVANVAKKTTLTVKNDGVLTTSGNFTATRNTDNTKDKDGRIKLENNGILTISGDFTYNYLNAKNENQEEIEMKDNAQMNVSGNFYVNQVTGEDFEIKMSHSSILNVTGNMIFDIDGGNEVELDINNSTSINVTGYFQLDMDGGGLYEVLYSSTSTSSITGNMTINKNGGGNVTIDLTGTTSRLNVGGNLVLNNSENADLIKIDLDGNSAILDVNGNIDLTGAASAGKVEIELDNAARINLAGNILRTAAPNDFGLLDFNQSSLLVLDGTANQILTYSSGAGAEGIEYMNVQINNSYGTSPQISTNGVVSIAGTLTFVDGVINATSSNYIELKNGAAASGASNASHVDGYVRKIGNSPAAAFPFNFPVGDEGFYAPTAIAKPSNATDAYEATYVKRNPSDDGYSLTSKDPTIDHLSTNEYWIVNRVNGSTDVTVTLSWDDNRSGSVTNMAELVVSRWNGSLWIDNGNGGTSGTNASGSVVTNVAAASFGPFSLGSSGSSNPLPVVWMNFNAVTNNSAVEISWETATEINCDYYVIERSSDAKIWYPIMEVKGSGNSTQMISYFEIDQDPLEGNSYYRIKQVDFDGTLVFSNLAKVHVNFQALADMKVYPNPNSGEEINIRLSNLPSEEILVVIRDLSGRELYSKVSLGVENGILQVLHNPGNLPAGTYIIVASSANLLISEKMVVKK